MSYIMTGASDDEVWSLVRDFHYSRRSPSAIRHAFAWREPGGLFGETGDPLAAVSYSQPVNRNFPPDSVELSRLVRREDFSEKLSAFVAWSLRWLRQNTEIPFVISYADSTQGHHGGIYQACNFKYVGATEPRHIGFEGPDGSFIHARSCNARLGTSSIAEVAKLRPEWTPKYGDPKHLYVYPIRQKWKKVAERMKWADTPYPKPDLASANAHVQKANA